MIDVKGMGKFVDYMGKRVKPAFRDAALGATGTGRISQVLPAVKQAVKGLAGTAIGRKVKNY